jgi:hypothetical protein
VINNCQSPKKNTPSADTEGPAMGGLSRSVAGAIAIVAFALATVSCRSPVGGDTPEVVVTQDASGGTIVRLAEDDQDGIWRLQSGKHNILVTRGVTGLYDVNLNVTLPDGGVRQIRTQIKATPGQTIPIGGVGDAKILVEFPSK